MVDTTDIFVKVSFNYQGIGKSEIPNGSIGIKNIVGLIESDYDAEEDDSIVCISVEILKVPLPIVLNTIREWATVNLKNFYLITTEVHCGVLTSKISHNEAIQVKKESDAWQLEIDAGRFTFIYPDDIEKHTKIETLATKRVTSFWNVLDSVVNM